MNADSSRAGADSSATAFGVRLTDWGRHGEAMSEVRRLVFVVEQGVPLDLEWDGVDPDCVHAIAVAQDGTPIGTGRLLPDGRIGRMAVLAQWRGHGVGRALLRALLDAALQRGDADIHLHAQLSALGFYERMGFCASGAEFLDAGIRHCSMHYRAAATDAG
jgi:predicted GNAT family N-acyltransferase